MFIPQLRNSLVMKVVISSVGMRCRVSVGVVADKGNQAGVG